MNLKLMMNLSKTTEPAFEVLIEKALLAAPTRNAPQAGRTMWMPNRPTRNNTIEACPRIWTRN